MREYILPPHTVPSVAGTPCLAIVLPTRGNLLIADPALATLGILDIAPRAGVAAAPIPTCVATSRGRSWTWKYTPFPNPAKTSTFFFPAILYVFDLKESNARPALGFSISYFCLDLTTDSYVGIRSDIF